MPAPTVTLEKSNKPFSEYPEAVDAYFQKRKIVIYTLPSDVKDDNEKRLTQVVLSSAQQYISYLDEEIDFWKKNDPQKKLGDYTRIDSLLSARDYFIQATRSSNSTEYYLNYSYNACPKSHLNSKTKLAQLLLKYPDKNKGFFDGFMGAMQEGNGRSISTSAASLEGFAMALEYRKVTKSIQTTMRNYAKEFADDLELANENLTRLNMKYTASFHEQERRLAEIAEQTNQYLKKMNEDSEQYFNQKEQRCTDLETLYEEKLKLQAPAEYWNEMERFYTRKGRIWLTVSVVSTLVIISVLIAVLALMPNLFTEDSHWLEVFKNSAIITVVTSIAVYMLRLFVKLSVSSFHLARDAKERNKLTFFYLSLIEKKAVTEKERAIILNSLFSRADTGLLKGDSSPTMSGNISELVEVLNKK